MAGRVNDSGGFDQQDSNRLLFRRLHFSYGAALVLIASLAIAVHFLLDDVITQQGDSATIVNIAGRQRMLSQRIALLSGDLLRGDEAAREPLKQAARLMARSQNALEHGGDLGISNHLSPTAIAYYFGGGRALSPSVKKFVEAAERFSESPRNALDMDAYQIVDKSARNELLPALDGAVSLFEEEAKSKIHWLSQVQSSVTLILLVTLFGEAFLIFRPLVRKVKEYASRLYLSATRDSLTGLANRRFFMESASRYLTLATRSSTPFAMIALDVDHFKRINDTVGHAGGDAALRRLGVILRSTLRPSDLVGRIGGDEFAILLPDTDVGTAISTADRLRHAIEQEDTEGIPLFTVSLGVAATVGKDVTTDHLLAEADAALYQAKNTGRNRVSLSPALSAT